jgi:hypothetical protein
MIFFSDPKIVSKTPLATVVLLEGANLGQLYRMWSTHTALGQSLTGWILVSIALILWLNFYRVCCPEQKWAFWATAFGIFMNALVILSVIWFRYLV